MTLLLLEVRSRIDLHNSRPNTLLLAGTAGNVIAARLTENPNSSVLVIEAGVTYASHAHSPRHPLRSSVSSTDSRTFLRNENVIDAIVPFFATRLTPNTEFTWNYTTTNQTGLNGRSLEYPRGRILGGSSSVSEYQVALCVIEVVS
jgi:choline dehydrogenase